MDSWFYITNEIKRTNELLENLCSMMSELLSKVSVLSDEVITRQEEELKEGMSEK